MQRRCAIRILVTNDDSLNATGLWALVEELVKIAEVVVVAPDREQSGIGTAVTIHDPLRVRRVHHVPVPVPAYAVQGTPADCVILAQRALVSDRIDLVVAGINEGANLGNDVLISGTVSAAIQGHFHQLPAVAISVAALQDTRFEVAARLTGILVEHIERGDFPNDVLLNVNVPNRPLQEINGIMITHLARNKGIGVVQDHVDARGKTYYWLLRGHPRWEMKEGTDVWALHHGSISITPLHTDLANSNHFAHLARSSSLLSSALLAKVPPDSR